MGHFEDGHVEVEPDVDNGFVEEPEVIREKLVPEPESGAALFTAASEFLSLYGWYILFAVLGVWYLKNRYNSQLNSWQQSRENQQNINRYSSSQILERQEAIERARRRLQDKHNQKAEEFAEKQKLKEEERRKAEIEDWERHQQGRGYKSKQKVEEDYYPSNSNFSSSKPKQKKTLRDGFNPLMGGNSGGYRAPRRGFSGGG